MFDCAMDLPNINLPLLNDIALDLCDVLSHCGEGCAGSTVLYAGAGHMPLLIATFCLCADVIFRKADQRAGHSGQLHVCVCACVHVCACMHVCVRVCVCVCLCVCTHNYTFAYIPTMIVCV